MKYYQLKKELWRPSDQKMKVYPSAYLDIGMQGYEFLHSTTAEGNTKNIDKFVGGYLPKQVPVFDYFVLKQLYASRKRSYDWILLDVYSMALSETFLIVNDGILVSERLKQVLGKFKLPQHKFYPALLMYKGEKLNYYLLRTGIKNTFKYANSIYRVESQVEEPKVYPFWKPTPELVEQKPNVDKIVSAQELRINNEEDFYNRKAEYCKMGQQITLQSYVFADQYDYFNSPFPISIQLVSEPLKQALEQTGIIGFEFHDLGHKTVSFVNS